MPARAVATFAQALKSGDVVYCRWGRGPDKGEYIGRITKEASPGLPAAVTWFKELCPPCNVWRRIADLPTTLPASSIVYKDLQKVIWERDKAEAGPCACNVLPSSNRESSEGPDELPPPPIPPVHPPPTRHHPYSALVLGPTQETQNVIPQSPTRVIELQDNTLRPEKTEKTVRLTHGTVRRMVTTLSLGTHFETSWSTNGESGTWLGVIARQSYPGIPTQVQYPYEYCNRCAAWHAFDDPSPLWDLPARGVSYYTLRTIESPPIAASKCAARTPPLGCEDASTELLLSPCTSDDSDSDTSTETETEPQAPPMSAPHQLPLNQRQPRSLTIDDLFADERQLPVEASGSPSLKTLLGVHIFAQRPGHVPVLAWRTVSEGTRRLHIRWLRALQAITDTRSSAPIASAIVGYVLQHANQRHWTWSTVSSTLSTIASAVAALPLYSNQTVGHDLRQNPLYHSALKRAAHLAKISHIEHPTVVMRWSDFSALQAKTTSAPVRLLLELSWFFAARVGDMRKVLARDVEITPHTPFNSAVNITFRMGKGAAWWGPYTIRSILPQDVAQRLSGWLSTLAPTSMVFQSFHQRILSTITNAQRFPLRSIRRGMLVHMAQKGVGSDDLMVLSGHKNPNTLSRYLGWGKDIPSTVAEERVQHYGGEPSTSTQTEGTTSPSPDAPARTVGPRVGPHSGYVGNQGRRTRAPPTFLPIHAPSTMELGIDKVPDPSWPLHAKHVGTLNWDEVHALASEICTSDPIFREKLRTAQRWLLSTDFYYPPPPAASHASLSPPRPTTAKFRPGDLATLLAAGKIEPCIAPQNWTTAWLTPQFSKQRFRPIFEPRLNCTLSDAALPVLHYPSRVERRANLRRFIVELDFAGYFDQFEMSPEVRSHYAFASDGAIYQLTRMPMGARFAPGVAQLVTWLVAWGVTTNVTTVTVIDNIRICSDSLPDLRRAYDLVVARAHRLGITINAHDFPTALPARSLGEQLTLSKGHIFVGICENHRNNLTEVKSRLEQADRPFSRRQLAAAFGLAYYCGSIFDSDVSLRLCANFDLLRAYSNFFAEPTGWDTIATAPTLRQLLALYIADVLRHDPMPSPSAPTAPPAYPTLSHFDAICVVDACSSGWAAYVITASTCCLVQQSFERVMKYSAHAEPLAASKALAWIKATIPAVRRVALVSDHAALASAQRRPGGGGGHSNAFFLNSALAAAYQKFDDCQIYHIPGEANPADLPSRSTDSLSLIARPATFSLPPDGITHPYTNSLVRETYMV